MNRFLAGELELTSSIPPEHFKRLKKQHPESVSVVGSLCTYYYRFNTGVKPFDDARVRKALSYAINRDVVSNALLGAGQKPAYFLTPEITDGFDPVKPAYANLTQKERDAEAKKLLEAAGFSPSNPLDFTLLYNTSESHKKIAVALASMWKRLGVKVTLENQEWKTYLDTTRKGNYQVARAGWCGDYNEASTFLTLMQSTNTSGGIHYGSTDYDKIINTALSASSDEERNKLYLDAEAKLADDMPIAPIYQYVNTRLIKPSVGGFPYGNAEGNIYTKDLYLKAN
jgi:oligopeptide transport system substrate-binding protein